MPSIEIKNLWSKALLQIRSLLLRQREAKLRGVDLGLSRSFFYLGVLFFVATSTPENLARALPTMWERRGLYLLFDSTLPSFELILVMRYFWMLTLFAAMIGLCGRISMMFSFVLGLLVWGIPVGFVLSSFQYYLPTVVLGIFAFSRANDHFSVDAWIRRKRHRPPAPEESDEYAWPLRLILFNVSMMYVAAALSKLRWSGWDWIFGDVLIGHLQTARENFASHSFKWVDPFAQLIFANPILVNVLAGLVFTLELTSIAAFFSKRAFAIYFPTWIAFHIGIGLFSGILVGYYYIPVFATLLFLYRDRPWFHTTR